MNHLITSNFKPLKSGLATVALSLFFLFSAEAFSQVSGYCTPTYDNGCSVIARITNVSLAGETVSLDNTTTCSGTDLTDYTDLAHPDLAAGGTYSISISTDYVLTQFEQAAAWIDYNNNFIFEDSEKIAGTQGNGLGTGTESFSFTVPQDAVSGDHRLRVRLVYVGGPEIDPCDNQLYGEAEDYTIEVVSLNQCQGTPSGGTADDSAFSVCAGHPFSVSVTGASAALDGLVRNWQSSPAGLNDWTAIPGATDDTYLVADGISEATDFRFEVTCTFADQDGTAYSDVIAVSLNPDGECYCIPSYTDGCSDGNQINNVTLIGATESINNDSGCSTGGYGDFRDLTPPNLVPGGTYQLQVSSDVSSPTNNDLKAWIDYNQNGSFDTDEVIGSTESTDGMDPSGTNTFEFTVPTTATVGSYTMRIRLVFDFYDNLTVDPCNEADYGEAEDYTIAITDLPDCTGTPTAGTVEDDFSVCSGDAFTLHITGTSNPANGLESTWQSSPTGEDTWTDIAGATANNYTVADGIDTPMDYRYKITCTFSNETSISDPIHVSLNPGEDCYCIPEYDFACNSGDYISNVSLIGETSSLNNDSECSLDSYQDNTDLNVPDLIPGYTYTLSISTGSTTPSSDDVRAWIDYNVDGNFDDSEEIANTNGAGIDESGTSSFDFSIPQGTAVGTYRMRVRLAYLPNGDISPCAAYNFGEAEDYKIEVIQPSCLRPTDLSTSFVSNSTAKISWTPADDETQWEVVYGQSGFDPSQATPISIQNTPKTILDDLTGSTDYDVYVRSICSDTDQSNWAGPLSFTTFSDNAPVNNNLCDAIAIEPNTGCQGGPFTNFAAFEELNEPTGSCLDGLHGTNSVWFSFVSTGTEATIDTDFPQTTIVTEIVVFEAPSDCADMTTLGSEIGCADFNGDVHLEGLTVGETYYFKVTGYNQEEGTFCIEVNTPMGVDSQSFESFAYFPNPVSGQLTLKAGLPIQSLTIFNLLGQQVLKTDPNALQTRINTDSLLSGVYLMKVTINERTKTFKLIKK